MTYNERFGVDYRWGYSPMAEYFVPSQDGSGATLLLCPQHAKAKSNFAMAKPIQVFCDTICDDCNDAFFGSARW